jgi:tripartite-type tricarboxylate transporter receptor subunit TctC
MKTIARGICLSLAFFGCQFSSNALAKDFYAGKNIRFIVGYAAGGRITGV